MWKLAGYSSKGIENLVKVCACVHPIAREYLEYKNKGTDEEEAKRAKAETKCMQGARVKHSHHYNHFKDKVKREDIYEDIYMLAHV